MGPTATDPPSYVLMTYSNNNTITTGPLEATGLCQPGDVLAAINGIALPTPEGHRADVARLQDPGLAFPCRLAFHRPAAATAAASYEVAVPAPPRDGQWGAVFGLEGGDSGGSGSGRPVLKGFRRLPGPLARRGLGETACRPGRLLLSLNGEPLPQMLRRIREEALGQGGGGGNGGDGQEEGLMGGGGEGGEGVWPEVQSRLQATLQVTPLPVTLVLRDAGAFAALQRWQAPVA